MPKFCTTTARWALLFLFHVLALTSNATATETIVSARNNLTLTEFDILEGETKEQAMIRITGEKKVIINSIKEEQNSAEMLVIIVLLFFCFVVSYFIKHVRFSHIQPPGATILIGALSGLVIQVSSGKSHLQSLTKFNSDLFMFILLPIIIFDAGFHMQKKNFIKNIGLILLLAFVGTLISTIVFALFLYYSGPVGGNLTLEESLLFGSLISSTDPVSVISIFKEMNVDSDLFSVVLGESVLNDAVSVVLFRTISHFHGQLFNDFATFSSALSIFLLNLIGSIVVGLSVAIISALFFKHMRLQQQIIIETTLLMFCAFISYLTAESVGLLGIVSVLFTGIFMSQFTICNLSKATRVFSSHLISFLGTLAETFVFALLGLSLFTHVQNYSFGMIVVSLIALILSRSVPVYSLTWLSNISKHISGIHPFPFEYSHIIVVSGLRGAIAFSLALTLPKEFHGPEIYTTTLILVVASVLGSGAVIVPLLKRFKVKTADNVPIREEVSTLSHVFSFVNEKFLEPFLIYRDLSQENLQLVESVISQDFSDSPVEGNKETLYKNVNN